MEVIRFNVHSIFQDLNYEGYFAPNWTRGYKYHSPSKVPYGCWFFSAPGSGIYINVGNNLVITGKKKEINKLFSEYLNDNG